MKTEKTDIYERVTSMIVSAIEAQRPARSGDGRHRATRLAGTPRRNAPLRHFGTYEGGTDRCANEHRPARGDERGREIDCRTDDGEYRGLRRPTVRLL